MTAAKAPYAALIFVGADAVDSTVFRRLADQALADHDECGGSRKPASDDPDLIAGTDCYVRIAQTDDINPRTGKASGVRVVVSVNGYGDLADPEKLHGILVNIVTRALRKTEADFIEWLSPSTVMDRDEFLEVGSYVSKRRGKRHNAARLHASERHSAVTDLDTGLLDRLNHEMDDKMETDFQKILKSNQVDGWDPAEMNLARLFRSDASEAELIVVERERDEAMSSQMRLASWALTGTVATISLPVAVSLTIVSVAKGEDFRLNTHVLAVTGLLATLSMNGMLNVAALLGV